MSQEVKITYPDDWHVHLRDGDMLSFTVEATEKHFRRALVMPNLQPPLTTIEALKAYRQRVLSERAGKDFEPYFTFYLNESITPDVFALAKSYPWIFGAKLYPKGVTTNSEVGADSIQALYPLFEAMQAQQMVLQVHGEVLEEDIFEREALFLEMHLSKIVKNFPKLRVVLEHISTREAVQFVTDAGEHVAATITPHHLMYNRNQLLSGGIKPHYYCLPILKHAKDQKAVQEAAFSGNPKFFAGTDSAPHPKNQKECASGCAGVYSAPFALAMYAEVFDEASALTKLDAFLGGFGADFYHLPINNEKLVLVKQPTQIPEEIQMGTETVVPISSGGQFTWSVL